MQKVNHKGNDCAAQTCRLLCTFAVHMRGCTKFCQRGFNFDNTFFLFFFFCLIRGGRIKIHVPLLACRWWPDIECWLGSFVTFQGIRTSIAKKPYIFQIFQGGPDPLSPPLDPPMVRMQQSQVFSRWGPYWYRDAMWRTDYLFPLAVHHLPPHRHSHQNQYHHSQMKLLYQQ